MLLLISDHFFFLSLKQCSKRHVKFTLLAAHIAALLSNWSNSKEKERETYFTNFPKVIEKAKIPNLPIKEEEENKILIRSSVWEPNWDEKQTEEII